MALYTFCYVNINAQKMFIKLNPIRGTTTTFRTTIKRYDKHCSQHPNNAIWEVFLVLQSSHLV